MKTNILIAGGSGLIGSRLMAYLPEDKYHFHILSRSEKANKSNVSYFKWSTRDMTIDLKAFENVDVVINLAGAGIADKRWTAARKKVILDSRLDSIACLTQGLAQLDTVPSLYIGASAVGYYGNQGDKLMTEDKPAGTGFLAEVTEAWEEASVALGEKFERSTILRIGIVLSKNGGALKEILKPAALGTYGYFGDGSAYYSWIHIDDICKIIESHVTEDKYEGIYNATAPQPVTIKELVKAVKKAKSGFGLVMPVPTIALKLAMGEMVQMLTDSMRVKPERLLAEGYSFHFDDPVVAIKDILERKV